MTQRGYRLSRAARADAEQILRETGRRFGTQQRHVYQELMERAALMVAATPTRPGSRARDDLAKNMRSFPVELASSRRGAAAHILYYIPEGPTGAFIVRILHERMDPTLHIAGSER